MPFLSFPLRFIREFRWVPHTHNVGAYSVGVSKEGLPSVFWGSLFFALLELLESAYTSQAQVGASAGSLDVSAAGTFKSSGFLTREFVVLPRLAMASTDPSLIMRDHLYSLDDKLKRGRPPPLLKSTGEDIAINCEPMPETTPVIDPTSISRCCIERDLFPAVPLFFQYPCGTSKGWSEWVDRELKDPSTCDILNRAGVLDAIFISKGCDIHIEAKLLRHVVRRWSIETHTFICSCGEFTPTLEDVANIFHLPLWGDQDPFHVIPTIEDRSKLEVLQRGAPTFPSTSLRFSNWIQHFEDVNRHEPCRLAAFVSLWLGKFLFCDFSQDCVCA
ncbi:uncharacterized protein Pyn_23523 [Prunus yedoensis var. nudiflora]|uniref:Aminotransferase-like plant mobile domain-containing protein n=1 Tax=Prunus yedoensis var. nudiflora TaxID=2094558 RepID=A0A314ZGG5_PRUYE|nr:uncharacterized protein Pyn_23523 [Prunus yedoensis var. nudiflora]